jgi:hypothetical protein
MEKFLDFKWDLSEEIDHRLRLTGGFAAFEPFGLWPATRAAVRKNESSRFAFFLYRKGGTSNAPELEKILEVQATRSNSCTAASRLP